MQNKQPAPPEPKKAPAPVRRRTIRDDVPLTTTRGIGLRTKRGAVLVGDMPTKPGPKRTPADDVPLTTRKGVSLRTKRGAVLVGDLR